MDLDGEITEEICLFKIKFLSFPFFQEGRKTSNANHYTIIDFSDSFSSGKILRTTLCEHLYSLFLSTPSSFAFCFCFHVVRLILRCVLHSFVKSVQRFCVRVSVLGRAFLDNLFLLSVHFFLGERFNFICARV